MTEQQGRNFAACDSGRKRFEQRIAPATTVDAAPSQTLRVPTRISSSQDYVGSINVSQERLPRDVIGVRQNMARCWLAGEAALGCAPGRKR